MNYVYNRQTPRAQWHHYNGGDYFVTICTKNREHYFGKVVNDTVQLTKIGEFLKLQIENTEKIRNGDVTIPIYVIMPNHVHLIIAVRTDAVRPNLRGGMQIWNAIEKFAINYSWYKMQRDKIRITKQYTIWMAITI